MSLPDISFAPDAVDCYEHLVSTLNGYMVEVHFKDGTTSGLVMLIGTQDDGDRDRLIVREAGDWGEADGPAYTVENVAGIVIL